MNKNGDMYAKREKERDCAASRLVPEKKINSEMRTMNYHGAKPEQVCLQRQQWQTYKTKKERRTWETETNKNVTKKQRTQKRERTSYIKKRIHCVLQRICMRSQSLLSLPPRPVTSIEGGEEKRKINLALEHHLLENKLKYAYHRARLFFLVPYLKDSPHKPALVRLYQINRFLNVKAVSGTLGVCHGCREAVHTLLHPIG